MVHLASKCGHHKFYHHFSELNYAGKVFVLDSAFFFTAFLLP